MALLSLGSVEVCFERGLVYYALLFQHLCCLCLKFRFPKTEL